MKKTSSHKKMTFFLLCIGIFLLLSCAENRTRATQHPIAEATIETLEVYKIPDIQEEKDMIIIDSNYTFEEAIAGTRAPQEIIDQLELIEVRYLSTTGRIHQGQIVANRRIAQDIREIFEFMLEHGFIIEQAVPIVRYNWCDTISMDVNNSHSFNYRKIAGTNVLSLHATGMAIDINPRFNPVRWRNNERPNQPEGAVHDPTVNGTLYPGHPVVEEFRRRGFHWGHWFRRFYDDHHFERR